MSNIVINSNTYQNIDYIRVPTEDESIAQAPIIAETPSGVTLLKYLDTTGSGHVDTGIVPTYPSTGFEFRIKFGILDATNTQIVCTTQYSSDSVHNDQLVLAQGGIIMMRTHNSFGYKRFLIHQGDIVQCVSSYYGTERAGCEYGENLTTHAAYGGPVNSGMMNISPTQNLLLFAEKDGSTYKTFAMVRFYEMVYMTGSTEVIHLYPAIDSNGVKCLYDAVGKTCIYSSDGAFTSE